MTRILTRYLMLDMIRPSLVALFVMVSVIWLLQSLRFMDYIVNRGLNVSDFLMLTVLLVPDLLVIILPLSFFIGVCFTFKRLSEDSEMDALFATGFSRLRMLRPGLWAALIIAFIGYINMLFVMPMSKHSFKLMQHSFRNTHGALLLEEGTFNQIGDRLTIYTKERTADGNLKNVLIYDRTKPGAPITWVAKEGQLIQSTSGTPQLQLSNAARLEARDNQLYSLTFDHSSININQQGDSAYNRSVEPDERFITSLWNPREKYAQRKLAEYRTEFIKRLVWPLTPVPLLFLAGLFVVRPQKSRSGNLKMLCLAGLCGGLYIALMTSLASMAQAGSTFIMYAQPLLPLLACGGAIWLMADPESREGTL